MEPIHGAPAPISFQSIGAQFAKRKAKSSFCKLMVFAASKMLKNKAFPFDTSNLVAKGLLSNFISAKPEGNMVRDMRLLQCSSKVPVEV